ncbi:MAG TPA: response regulator [Polyangiales bacterium]|nr:response regulator [Polyangiales bacterium]
MSTLVLVADSDPFNLRLLSELCGTLGYDVMTAADGGAVLDAMARQRPSLVVMDAFLPGMDGLQVLRILKADAGLCRVPVLLVTPEEDTQSRERGLALGAEDYVSKPYRPFEIQQRMLDALAHSAPEFAFEPDERTERLVVDPLTKTGTNNQLHISLDYEFTRAVRYKHSLSCVVIRCLNYSELAQQLGQRAPEVVIAPLANAIRGGVRNVDHLFRSDAGEFTVLLPETGIDGARIVVERLRALLREPGLFATPEVPAIAVAAASYPKEAALDGEALHASARRALL